MEEKKLATMICCNCGNGTDKNYAKNTIGNYCKRCAFDRALKIQIDKYYESGAMDENIIFDVENAVANNQNAGAYVEDLRRIIHRLQDENSKQKAEIERLTEELNGTISMNEMYVEKVRQNAELQKQVDELKQAVKDTAKEILQELYDQIDDNTSKWVGVQIKIIAKRKGVEVE